MKTFSQKARERRLKPAEQSGVWTVTMGLGGVAAAYLFLELLIQYFAVLAARAGDAHFNGIKVSDFYDQTVAVFVGCPIALLLAGGGFLIGARLDRKEMSQD